MSNENHDTIADIVKRVRRDCNSYPLPTAAAEMLKLVREIEAAHKREREATCEKSSHVGNAAKMREALEQIRELLSIGGNPDTAMCIRYEAAYQIAKEALAEPLRNCDVGTTDDQFAMFHRFCDKYENCKECPVWRGGGLISKCYSRWSHMLYEKVETK